MFQVGLFDILVPPSVETVTQTLIVLQTLQQTKGSAFH